MVKGKRSSHPDCGIKLLKTRHENGVTGDVDRASFAQVHDKMSEVGRHVSEDAEREGCLVVLKGRDGGGGSGKSRTKDTVAKAKQYMSGGPGRQFVALRFVHLLWSSHAPPLGPPPLTWRCCAVRLSRKSILEGQKI